MFFILIIYLHDLIFTLSFILSQHQNNDTTATNVVSVVIDNMQSSFVLFVASIQSYNYGVTYFRLIYFILSIFCSNTISTCFVAISENEVSLFFVLERKLFLRFDWFYFSIDLKSLYDSYLPLYTIFIIFIFNHPIWNQFSLLPLYTIVTPAVIENGPSSFFWFVA